MRDVFADAMWWKTVFVKRWISCDGKKALQEG